MKIFSIELVVKDPNSPFNVEYCQLWESGDIVWILAQFNLNLIKVLKEIHEQDLKEQLALHGLNPDDDIPF